MTTIVTAVSKCASEKADGFRRKLCIICSSKEGNYENNIRKYDTYSAVLKVHGYRLNMYKNVWTMYAYEYLKQDENAFLVAVLQQGVQDVYSAFL